MELSLLPSYWWATHNFVRFVTTSPPARRHTGSHENSRRLATISLRAARFHSTVSLQPYPELILGSHVSAMYFLVGCCEFWGAMHFPIAFLGSFGRSPGDLEICSPAPLQPCSPGAVLQPWRMPLNSPALSRAHPGWRRS